MVNFIVIFAIITLLIDWLIKKTIIQPIIPMAKLAQEISKDEINSESPVELNLRQLNKVVRRFDELGQLARAFQLMTEVVRSREQTLKQQVKQLRRENDSVKKFTNLMTKKGKVVRDQPFQELRRFGDLVHRHELAERRACIHGSDRERSSRRSKAPAEASMRTIRHLS